jgi:site-specific DNA-methyltransferase (adenine-specific)
MKSQVVFSRESDEWGTPDELFDALHEEFNFGLDAAATCENTKLPCFISPDEDALTVSWVDHAAKRVPVWLNPPYSQVAAFVKKAYEESLQGSKIVMLLPARTDTRWFHDFIWNTRKYHPQHRVEIRFLRGRLKFTKPAQGKDGPTNSAPFPSMIVVFPAREMNIVN